MVSGMIPKFPLINLLSVLLILGLLSCSENQMQVTVFTDGFQELEDGQRPDYDPSDPATCYFWERGGLGDWKVATHLEQEGFKEAWIIKDVDGSLSLEQTFTNLNEFNAPLSLITHPLITAGDSTWGDMTLEAEFTPRAKFDKCGIVFGYRNPSDFFFFGIEGNTIALKYIEQAVTPLRPVEHTLKMRPVVWNPGERFRATVTIRRNRITSTINDSIHLYSEAPAYKGGKIGLLSDLPASFHSMEVKLLNVEKRKLNRKMKMLERRAQLHLRDYPEMVRWKHFDTGEFGSGKNIRLGDLTGDGNKEIIFVGTARKGLEAGKITVMNLDGEILWQYGREGQLSNCAEREIPLQIHDLDGDGEREVIFAAGAWLNYLDGRTGKRIKRTRIPGKLDVQSLQFADLRGVGRDNCILMSDHASILLALDETGKFIWMQKSSTGSHPMIFDMDGDGMHEILMGYAVFSPEGRLLSDAGAYIGDDCNGVAVSTLKQGEEETPVLVYAAGDWGLVYCDYEGHLLKQNIVGNVEYLGVTNMDLESEGPEIITSNRYGSYGLVHFMDAAGEIHKSFLSESGLNRCVTANWKGDGEEFLISSADSLHGGLFDRFGNLSVRFPSDGHPLAHYMAADLIGDARDEILVWDRDQLWIYTQEDNPRMGNTYAPRRQKLYNYSMHQMHYSVQKN